MFETRVNMQLIPNALSLASHQHRFTKETVEAVEGRARGINNEVLAQDWAGFSGP